MWEGSLGIRSESHEMRTEFRVDPVGFGESATVGCESFDLSWRQLLRRDAGIIQATQSRHACPPVASKQTSALS